jgi:hypothetical protein
VERATAEMKDNRATGDDDVPGDLLKLLREDGLRTVTEQINNIYETGDWTKDFSEVTVIALKKKPRATKYSDRHTISLITYSVKIAARTLGLSFEGKIEGVFGENNLGFRRGKGASDAMEMLRIVQYARST